MLSDLHASTQRIVDRFDDFWQNVPSLAEQLAYHEKHTKPLPPEPAMTCYPVQSYAYESYSPPQQPDRWVSRPGPDVAMPAPVAAGYRSGLQQRRLDAIDRELRRNSFQEDWAEFVKRSC
jgi:hypothetical protein